MLPVGVFCYRNEIPRRLRGIAGASGTNVSFANATTLTARTPSHAPSVVVVRVTNPDSQAGTLTGGLTYRPSGEANVVLRISFAPRLTR